MTEQAAGDKAGGEQQQEAAPKTGSMLDVEKIKAGAKEATAEEQPGTKVVTGDPTAKAGEGDAAKSAGEKLERPAFVPEKFWDAEKGAPKLEAMSKAFTDMEKAFRAGDHKAPEKPDGYKVTLDDKQKELLFGAKDADPHADPLFKQLTGWGVKNKISQAAMSEIMGMYAEASGEEAGKFQIDVTAERAALGKNADAIIQNQHDFLGQMYKNGEIGEAELKEASILFETAAGIKLLQAIRGKYGEQTIPTALPTVGDDVPSAEELGRMTADPKYGTDKEYTAKVQRFYSQRYGDQPAMSSIVAKG
jgi:hypothetical protein